MAKPSLTSKILDLLGDERAEVRCAAALVLGAAGKGDPAVARALAAHLSDPSAMVVRFLLDALEAVGARGLASPLAPLLGASDDEVRTRALRLMAAQGAQAEGALRRELGRGSAAARRQAAALLVKVGSAAATDALLEQLADREIGEHLLQLLRAELDHGEPKRRAAVLARATAGAKKIGPKQLAADPDAAARLAALLRLIGYLADPKSLPLLVANAGSRSPHGVRLGAIAALRRIVAHGGGGGAEDAVASLIGWADDADPAIARAAVDTLRGAQIPEKLARKFGALAQAKNPDARRLAMERMAVLGGASAIPTLLANLAGTDAGLRDTAARALAAAPEAAAAVAKALGDAESEEAARRLQHVLRAHGERVPAAATLALARRTAERLRDPADRAVPVILEALAHVAPDAHARVLFDRAAALRKSGRHQEAFAALRPLAHTSARLDDEQRFTIGVMGLKAGGKNLLRSARAVDPVLMQFAQLVSGGYPVTKQLAKQKDVDLEDLFNLGFNFIESTDGSERALGEELLELVVAKQPRGKLATAAKNKLRLAGAD